MKVYRNDIVNFGRFFQIRILRRQGNSLESRWNTDAVGERRRNPDPTYAAESVPGKVLEELSIFIAELVLKLILRVPTFI